MSIDPYTICPGGTGKKIKFCCSDLVSELDKLQRMIEGEQNVAALDYATKLEAKYPQRACLMGARSMLEIALEKLDQAGATLKSFLEKYPDNPVALSQLALLKCREGKAVEALPLAFKMFETAGQQISEKAYHTMTMVAVALATEGHLLAARGLLLRQLQLSGGKDQEVGTMLMQLQRDSNLPLAAKHDPDFAPAPEGAPWKFEFDRAYQRAREAQWAVAEEKFKALIPLAGQSPALWQNLALLRGRLGNEPGMAEALHRLASLDVPHDDAVEAEALAQYVDETGNADTVDVVELEFTANSQADLEERLAADRQIERVPFDPRGWPTAADTDDGHDPGPPPRAVFNLLDKPTIPSAQGITAQQVPIIIGSIQLFGRQTDRPERLLLSSTRDQLAVTEALVKRIGGDALGDRFAAGEQVIDKVRTVAQLFQWEWRIPRDAKLEDRKRLVEEERRERVLNRLPKLRLAQIGNQTLEEAAKEPAGRIRAAAFISLLASPIKSQQEANVFDDLRRQLGLPVPGPIDPTTVANFDSLPPSRYQRLEVEKLSDDWLVTLYRRSRSFGADRATRKLAEEIIRRPALAEKLDMADLHGVLARLSEDRDEALRHIDEARAIYHRDRLSSAIWDIQELATRLQFGDVQGAARTFDHIRREHIREEGVPEALSQLLMSLGLVDESGRVLLPPVEEASSSPLVVPGDSTSKIITPDNLAAAASEVAAGAGERKSALWTPGMD